MTIYTGKDECRKVRINDIKDTLAGRILEKIEENYESKKDFVDEMVAGGWKFEPVIDLDSEEICLLRGWNALGLLSYSYTLGQNFISIKDWNKVVRKVYFRTMQEIA